MRDIWKEIDDKLNEIEEKEGVRVLHAIESGSRAWGFASPDSDYDVRFVYVRNIEDYLRLDEPKDTIDWQLDEVLDTLWEICQRMQALLIEIKSIVLSARYYAASTYEWWMHEAEQARREGRRPPDPEDFEPRDRSGDIRSPDDPDLGWNALGITPPFLDRREESEGKREAYPDSYVDHSEDSGVPGLCGLQIRI